MDYETVYFRHNGLKKTNDNSTPGLSTRKQKKKNFPAEPIVSDSTHLKTGGRIKVLPLK